jgi:hypothetical protein
LQGAAERLQPRLDPKQRPDDSTQNQATENDQHCARPTDQATKCRVEHRARRHGGDQQGGEAQTVGDDVPSPLGEALTEQ